ncbi:MAG: aminodeoxychorismate synthase component I [Longimicrobiaceae bacterium]
MFTVPEPLVRFDSLDARRGAGSFRFDGFRGIIRADSVDEVLPALLAVEDAVAGGAHAAGFVAYEAAPAFDPALATRRPDPRIPLLWFALFERRSEADPDDLSSGDGDADLGDLQPDVAEDDFAARVGRIRELIAAGDTYQVNYTFRLRGDFRGPPKALYRRLCQAQQAAFCAYLDFGDGVIVSASPELFFRWAEGELELRPMKGTRPRGRWLEEDQAVARELAASEKDRAENLMIVDLLRNDAGRIAEFGSVRVERMFEVEPYPTVHQMTSTVRARTPPETRLTDVFRALFPCGSITGAPKVRTSRIIAELEASPRGVYTGAIGFVSPGEAVFSVAIRTLVIDRATKQAELGVGSGITFDSQAADEYRECLSKAAFVRHEPPPALLETFGWAPETGFVRLGGHLARMARSAEYFGYPFDSDDVRRRLDALAAELPPAPLRVRIELSPRGEVSIEHSPAPRWEEPVRLAVARRHGRSDHPFWYHKTADRARYDAHDPVDVPHDQVLLVNERGELAETPIANLVVELDRVLWTPHVDAGLLPGVLRAELLRDGQIRERVLTVADLERATAVWVINSLRGWGRADVSRRNAETQ